MKESRRFKVMSVVGARPNFMKIAPFIKAINRTSELSSVLVHTGQHYDYRMSESFFEELDIPAPDINLEVGSGSHALQTAQIMIKFEKVIIEERPDLLVVVGDVNSTMACALVAAKLHIPIAHIEAGLRSRDRKMPEEINRIVTDSISTLLFAPSVDGVENLKAEGVDDERIHLVGNIMIDTLMNNYEKAMLSDILDQHGLKGRRYAVLTLHRPSNVDNLDNLTSIFKAVEKIQEDIWVIYPCHPRTRKQIESYGLSERLGSMRNLAMIDPIGYLDNIKLLSQAKFVMSDSGGIQEETSVLGVPCLTLRNSTERPITVLEGTNEVVGADTSVILELFSTIMNGNFKVTQGKPKYWDGKTAERIVSIILEIKDSLAKSGFVKSAARE